MAHIHTEPGQHDHTASAFIVRMFGKEPKVLLHIHKKLNRYLQFGGHIELDETPWETVKHETQEESGYTMDQLKILQPKFYSKAKASDVKNHPFPVSHNTHAFDEQHSHTDIAYVFVTDQEPRHQVAEGESGIISAFSRKEIVDMDQDKIDENMKEICLFIFDECLPNWQQIDPSEFDY